MKTRSWISYTSLLAFFLLGTQITLAATTTNTNLVILTNLTVNATATLKVLGASTFSNSVTITDTNNLFIGGTASAGILDATNDISYGATTNLSIPAVFLTYTNSTKTVGTYAALPSSLFLWQDNGGANNKMLLNGSNNLTLYSTNGSIGMILNPNSGGGITLSGTGSGITLVDGTVLSGSNSLHGTGVYSSSGTQLLSADANGTNLDISAPIKLGTNTTNFVVQASAYITNTISYGTTTNGTTNMAAVLLSYTDTNHTVGFVATKPSSSFNWQDNGGSNNKLLLDASNNLTLYATNGSNGVAFNPNTGSISLAGGTNSVTLSQPSASFKWQDNGISGTNKNKLLLDGSNNLTLYGTYGSAGIVINPNAGGGITFPDGTTQTTAIANIWMKNTNGGVVSGASSFSVGSSASATGANSTAFGYGSVSSGDYSTVFGYEATASGCDSTALGWQCVASGDYSMAFGVYTTATGENSTAFGVSTIPSGYNSTALGCGSVASGDYSTAFGAYTTATGENSTALGVYTTAAGYDSTALGLACVASGDYSTAFGYTTTTASYDSVAFGQYNVGIVSSGGNASWVSTDPIMEIGNGANGNPCNAVTIFKSGEIRSEGLVQSQAGFRTPPQGDLGMGSYTNGANPATLNPATGLLYPSGN